MAKKKAPKVREKGDPNEIAGEVHDKLTADLSEMGRTMSAEEVRNVVDTYYQAQDRRKREANQATAIKNGSGGTRRINEYFKKKFHGMEAEIEKILKANADNDPLCRWAMSISGIQHVLAAGLKAHINFKKRPDGKQLQAVGGIWRFAGVDPSTEWMGVKKSKELVAEAFKIHDGLEGALKYIAEKKNCSPDTIREQALKYGKLDRENIRKAASRCPWNQRLKVIVWKLGYSFMMTSGYEVTLQVPHLNFLRVLLNDPQALGNAIKPPLIVTPYPFKAKKAKDGEEESGDGELHYLNSKLFGYVKDEHKKETGELLPIEGAITITLPKEKLELLRDVMNHYNSLGILHPLNDVYAGIRLALSDGVIDANRKEEAIYGYIYAKSKENFALKNASGAYATFAREYLKKHPEHKQAQTYRQGLLPDGHVEARAKRYAAKLFLSAYFTVGYFLEHGKLPEKPWIFNHDKNHKHLLRPPNAHLIPGLVEACDKAEEEYAKQGIVFKVQFNVPNLPPNMTVQPPPTLRADRPGDTSAAAS